MDVTGDDLAGVVDLFGGLTRPELERALEELAFKRGEDVPGEAFAADVEAALESYRLVAVEREDGDPLLVAGPTAFATLPDGAEDLPHIMDVPERSVDPGAAGAAARERLERDATDAVEAGDQLRIADLLEVTYDLETWAAVDADEVRERLDDARE